MHKFNNKLTRLLRYVFLVADYEPMETACASLMLLFSVVMLNPYTDVYSNGAFYDIVRSIISEEILGTILMFVALNSLFALIDGGLRYRKYMSIATAFTFGSLFVLFLAANPKVLFPWSLGLFFFFSLAVSTRIHKDMVLNIPSWTLRQ